ncbi:MAG: Flp pilus assembly complex ATPase component TadA [Elusimicrobia bacterium]|nr:Flp pilus assembly complex ATPase component TadA [Elusimicrobiota bacterium]
MSRRLGELLVQSKRITFKQLQNALEIQKQNGSKLGTVLIQENIISENELLTFLAKQCGITYERIDKYSPIPKTVIDTTPENIARTHNLIPVQIEGQTLTVAMGDPLNIMVLDDLKAISGYNVKMVLASDQEIKKAIDKYYGVQEAQDTALNDIIGKTADGETPGIDVIKEDKEDLSGGDSINILGEKESAPVIQLVNVILARAIKAKASDIHIEPYAKSLRIRFRIDGVLHQQPAPPKHYLNAIVSRLKIMSNLNISERRVPQDGRIKLKIGAKEIDMRLSVCPCAPGEKIVMRILDSSALKLDLASLGLEPESMAIYKKCIRCPHGIILVTGPTGSGKSTTLYSTLSVLNTEGVNIMTVEDPVEFTVEGINQVQAHAAVGLTFAGALRSFLRQDPDVIMVGEIRDKETGLIAINAALTGHLVLSTLHTNSAPGAVTRLGTMDIEPFLISSSLLMVIAQRLLRVICPNCKEYYSVDVDSFAKFGIPKRLARNSKGKITLARGRGCDNCAHTGYRGRQGIHEVLEINEPIRELVHQHATEGKIKEIAIKQGMLTLQDVATLKVLRGITTFEEMLRVTGTE